LLRLRCISSVAGSDVAQIAEHAQQCPVLCHADDNTTDDKSKSDLPVAGRCKEFQTTWFFEIRIDHMPLKSQSPLTRISRPSSKGWIVNTVLVVASLVVGLLIVELTLRWGIKARAVLTRQQLAGQGVTDADQAWERHPDLGWIIKANTTFRHSSPFGEFDTDIRTDAFGIRIPLELAQSRSPAQRNILVIGDSVTAAYEVPVRRNFR
jgi:hypothetical protein